MPAPSTAKPASLAVQWCLLHDPELDWRFAISPRSGRLVALPPAFRRDDDSARMALAAHGLRENEECPQLECDDSAQGPVGEPKPPRTRAQRVLLQARWSLCAALSRRAPLRSALARLARLPAWGSGTDRQEILDRVAFVERHFHPQLHTRQCLPRAMLRFWMLAPTQSSLEFNLGVWIPTQLMHAWVSVEGIPVGEEREELMHYRPCVRMTWTVDAA